MHILDSMMDAKTAIITTALAAGGLGLALRQARIDLPPRRVPLMGLAAAFVFAAQTLNFPVIAGTSGHLVGAVLAAVLLGPSAAIVVISAVLIVQCLMFSDGGVTALGANIFNMAIIGCAAGYAIYLPLTRLFKGRRGQIVAASFAAWCTVVLAAVACAAEISAAGQASWSKALPAMACIHMLIGVGEGLITAIVLVSIARLRPELFPDHVPATPSPPRYALTAAYGLLISLGLALFISPLASESPDGLETVAEKQHVAEKPTDRPVLSAPIPDYKMPGISSAALATSIAAAIGALVVFALSLLLARVLVPTTTRPTEINANAP
jgi:cobalt/nickel transport system permease protein